MACATGFTCSAGACRIDPTSRWNVVLEHLQVEPTYYTGEPWDNVGGTPDPYVRVRVGSETAMPAVTATASDAYEVVYDGGPTVMMARASDLQTYLGFTVLDDDSPPSFSDELVGNCVYVGASALSEAAFSGSTQTVYCPRNEATMNSGYTLSWHLEAF